MFYNWEECRKHSIVRSRYILNQNVLSHTVGDVPNTANKDSQELKDYKYNCKTMCNGNSETICRIQTRGGLLNSCLGNY